MIFMDNTKLALLTYLAFLCLNFFHVVLCVCDLALSICRTLSENSILSADE